MRPTRKQSGGMSPSELKIFLKKNGFKVTRNFFSGLGVGVAKKHNRMYMLTYSDFHGARENLCIRVSEPLVQFERWANSTEEWVPIQEFIDRYKI